MASNITSFTAIPDGSPATPDLFNSRFSQAHLNIVSVDSLAHDIQSGAESIATGAIGTIQLADRSVTGVKLATSAVTTRALNNASVTSLKIANSGVKGSNVSLNDSKLTAKQFIATDNGAGIAGDPLGTKARLNSEGIFWNLTSVTGPGSTGTAGLVLADTQIGVTGAYRQQNADTEFSTTSLAELALFSGNTTYMIAHSAGLVISNSSAPTGKGSGRAGDIRWASGFIYVCSSTSSWERAALSRF